MGFADAGTEELHDGWGEDMEAEEAEVVAGSQAGYDQGLFGFGWGRFFQQSFDLVEAGAVGNTVAAGCSVVGEFALVGGLDGGDRAILSGGDSYEFFGAAVITFGDIEVVTDHEEEGAVSGEGMG